MKKLEEILRDKPIKNKLSFAFRIMDILYVVLALVAVVELIRSKGYIGSIVVVVLLVLAIIFNASMSKMLAKMLIDPITNLVTASEKIASGDFEIGVPYESEDELGRLSDSFETAAAILKKVVSDLQTIVEQFSDGNFDVHSSCPAAVKQLKRLTELGFGNLPVCMAKNQYSLSDDPTLLGRPSGFELNVREAYVSAGAGFVVVLTGAVMTMPGLPKAPAAYNIDVDNNGKITGLF